MVEKCFLMVELKVITEYFLKSAYKKHHKVQLAKKKKALR